MKTMQKNNLSTRLWGVAFAGACIWGLAGPAVAQVTAFKQAVAEAAAEDPALAAFYRSRRFDGIWSSPEDSARRMALFAALEDADNHGIATVDYDPDALRAALRAADTPEEQGRMEVELSRVLLDYAQDVQTGMLDPRSVVSAIKREVPLRDRLDLIEQFAVSAPSAFMRSLPPSSPEYTRLMRAKLDLEAQLALGGWGETVSSPIEPGASGPQVVVLRNRLIAKGFLARTATQTYDAQIQAAVRRFQQTHGLTVDGVVGEGTLRELNRSVTERLQSVLVAMERERWLNQPLGDRHIWVNLADFHARIVDEGVITFETKSVVGHRDIDRQSPEFSDVMEFMVINPSWYVPRSIIVNEYLPALRRNPNAHGYMELTDSRGRVVNRGAVNFAQYTTRNFPFSMRQPPSPRNALGLVKFMFPNRYNIYLHDTPAKSLFSSEVRAYSHGCIRLNDPFNFAYTLLAPQTADPEEYFQRILRSGAETRVNLEEPVPVHLVYRTAFVQADGTVNYRGDIYGRDQAIWAALSGAGVVIGAPGG